MLFRENRSNPLVMWHLQRQKIEQQNGGVGRKTRLAPKTPLPQRFRPVQESRNMPFLAKNGGLDSPNCPNLGSR